MALCGACTDPSRESGFCARGVPTPDVGKCRLVCKHIKQAEVMSSSKAQQMPKGCYPTDRATEASVTKIFLHFRNSLRSFLYPLLHSNNNNRPNNCFLFASFTCD
ncbi:unnamed protein product [Ixodes pacificus]